MFFWFMSVIYFLITDLKWLKCVHYKALTCSFSRVCCMKNVNVTAIVYIYSLSFISACGMKKVWLNVNLNKTNNKLVTRLCLQLKPLIKNSFQISILVVSSIKVHNAGIITNYFIKFNFKHAPRTIMLIKLQFPHVKTYFLLNNQIVNSKRT